MAALAGGEIGAAVRMGLATSPELELEGDPAPPATGALWPHATRISRAHMPLVNRISL